MGIIEGTELGRLATNAGAPVAGTDAVHTITTGGTITGGTFNIAVAGRNQDVTWSATNATLLANVDAAMVALYGEATANFTVAAGTLTNGIGTLTITYVGTMGKLAVALPVVDDSGLTGTDPTAAIAETTPGVSATRRGIPKGGLLVDTTNAVLYINTGTATAPTWTKVGTQS